MGVTDYYCCCAEYGTVFDSGIPLETVYCPNLDMILQNI